MNKDSLSIKAYLLSIHKKAIISSVLIFSIIIVPIALLGLKYYAQISSKEIIESQGTYISYLLMNNDLVEIHRHFNSLVSTGPISKIKLFDPQGVLLADISKSHLIRESGGLSLTERVQLSLSGSSNYIIEWNYLIPIQSFFILFSFGLCFSILFIYFLRRSMVLASNKIVSPVENLSSALIAFNIEDASNSIWEEEAKLSGLIEIDQAIQRYSQLVFKLRQFEEKIRNVAQHEAMINIASQVAHDIRSPLSALNMLMTQMKEAPEQKRIIMRSAIQRINDIANELLEKGKQIQKNIQNQKTSSEETLKVKSQAENFPQLLSPLIDSMVSEKRIQFREKQGIEIEADLNQGYGLFANLNAIELKRTISNLLNNAIEAFPEEKGRVLVAVRNSGDWLNLTVEDNGKGMPKHILEKLGEMGLTHGKEGTQSGSGLGVYHAKKTVESFGGKFQITSQEGYGTTFTMSFPRVQAPKWFVEKLVFRQNMKVVSLDDDLSIHQVWKGRFESKNFHEIGIEHLIFTSGEEFKDWFSKNNLTPTNSNNNSNSNRNSNSTITNTNTSASNNTNTSKILLKRDLLFLMDYELLNQKATGLDLIEELGIGKQSILVSSRYEEDPIRSRCEKLGVRLIPKTMAGFVPIEIEKPKEFYHAVLIDDDEIPQMSWGMMAEEKNKKFIGFYKPEDFFQKASEIDFESPIYVDSNLGNNVKGEDVSLKIHELGFKNVHLCTGYDPSEFPQMHWIKSICPKDPQF